MAKYVLSKAYISIATNVLVGVTSLNLEPTADAPEVTAFGDEWRDRIGGGLKDSTLSLDYLQDHAAGAIDSILWPLLGTKVAFEARPTTDVRSPGNPSLRGDVHRDQHTRLRQQRR